MKRLLTALVVLCALVQPAFAVNPDEQLDDPVLEERARDISQGLRCLVCQNESIDDSNADLARDLRLLVRERLVAGDSNPEVEQYLVDRYGEFVLLAPRFAWHTLVLWLATPLVFLVGLVVLVLNMRRPANLPGTALNKEEEKALSELRGGGKK
ncbi:MAG: cytochrome c-type biogenesis protein CcmH [Alphaproteobacteria bacterium]|nr:cytochrome c-type biogenesis protein CcmH [Alphaproteobacteria bacterium]